MKRAFLNLRTEPPIRRESFRRGLAANGYDVRGGIPDHPEADTVLVLWNRYGDNHHFANRVEAAGGRVIVAENGYVGQGGSTPKFDLDGGMQPGHYIALALAGHNGSGRWRCGEGSRWQALGVDLKPWRTTGEHILVCPNRSFGRPDLIMPTDWVQQVQRRLQGITDRQIKVRAHPGTHAPRRLLQADLENCWAVVIWSSSSGLHALINGIPVIRLAPAWVAAGAAGTELESIEDPHQPDRLPHLERMAWAQWTFDEIAGGEPFRRLLDPSPA